MFWIKQSAEMNRQIKPNLINARGNNVLKVSQICIAAGVNNTPISDVQSFGNGVILSPSFTPVTPFSRFFFFFLSERNSALI